jgi:ribosome-associated translation inhibitor RaiA
VLIEFTDERLRVEITTKACDLSSQERARLQRWLAPVAAWVKGIPGATLRLDAVHHPGSGLYRVEGELKLPGRTLVTGEQDADLEAALRGCADKMTLEAEAYREQPDRQALAAAERRAALDEVVVAPEDPADGRLAESARAGNYRAFRIALADYEEWLRKRVGRIVQRIPEAQARVGRELLLGDVVEGVYLEAFERFTRRPTAVRLSEWLEGLIEPSIRALLRHPDEERAAASAARTARETALD